MLMLYICFGCAAVIHASPLNGDEQLKKLCRDKEFDRAGGDLIEPSNRTSCALFAEQEIYAPYRLRVMECGKEIHLSGTVYGAGDFDGKLVTCGEGGSKQCLQIHSSPGAKIDGAFMFYSNAEVELSAQKKVPVTYVASLDCKDGEPGQRYFEFRKAPSASELENIKKHYGITVDADKLAACLEMKNSVFNSS